MEVFYTLLKSIELYASVKNYIKQFQSLYNTMKLTIEQFELLKGIAPIVKSDQEEKKKEIKFKLLDGMQSAFGDKWYNLKKETKQALQYACMRSTEQGFFFFSPDHLKKKFGIGIATIYKLFKELIEQGVLIRINRTATSHNGKGNAVYVLTNHPNFKDICELLNINEKADEKANEKAENDETPTLPKAESDNQAPTYLLPTTLKNTKDNVIHYNVNEDDSIKLLRDKIEKAEKELQEKPYKKPAVKWHKFVPKAINEKFGYYGSILTDLWRKIKLAEKKVNLLKLREIDKMEVAMRVLDNLKKHPRRKQMSLDEMCGYVYKGQLNGLFNLMGNQHLECMYIDKTCDYYAYLDENGEHIPTTSADIVFKAPSSYNNDYYVAKSFYGEEPPLLENFPF